MTNKAYLHFKYCNIERFESYIFSIDLGVTLKFAAESINPIKKIISY